MKLNTQEDRLSSSKKHTPNRYAHFITATPNKTDEKPSTFVYNDQQTKGFSDTLNSAALSNCFSMGQYLRKNQF